MPITIELLACTDATISGDKDLKIGCASSPPFVDYSVYPQNNCSLSPHIPKHGQASADCYYSAAVIYEKETGCSASAGCPAWP
jgi:hypothetical protein